MTAVQSPRRIASAASPIAVVPGGAIAETAAEVVARWRRSQIAIVPELASTRPFAMKNGLTARAPLVCQTS